MTRENYHLGIYSNTIQRSEPKEYLDSVLEVMLMKCNLRLMPESRPIGLLARIRQVYSQCGGYSLEDLKLFSDRH